jgi:hypothetical protein
MLRLCFETNENFHNILEMICEMKPLFDLMVLGWQYLVCTCITELELAILDVMSVEHEFVGRIRITVIF